MPFPDVLGYIALGITWFFAVTYAFGVRIRTVGMSTTLLALLLLILALVFTFSNLSNLHLFWLVPLSFYLTVVHAYLAGWFRGFQHVTKLIASLYAGLLRIGAGPPRDFPNRKNKAS